LLYVIQSRALGPLHIERTGKRMLYRADAQVKSKRMIYGPLLSCISLGALLELDSNGYTRRGLLVAGSLRKDNLAPMCEHPSLPLLD